MRIWLDPQRLQTLGMTANDVVAALQSQNIQVAGGVLSQPPVSDPRPFQVAVQTQGRLADPAEFANIVVKQTPQAVVRMRDVANIELAALDYSTNSYLDVDPAVAIAVFQRPGSNALSTAKGIVDTMQTLSQRFPPGIKYDIIYNPTQFIQESVNEVEKTIFIATLLVVLVVILFLQTWRAALIPIVAIPVSLIGTFFFMGLFGFTLNNLSLFGLVLAIGIVVDDAIVVVENVQRNIERGLAPPGGARPDRDRAGADRGVRAVGVHHRHFRRVLSPVRAHHHRRHPHLAPGVADALAGHVPPPTQTARRKRAEALGAADPPLLRRVRPGVRRRGLRLRHLVGKGRTHPGTDARHLRRRHPLRPQRVPPHAAGFHPAGRPRLSHRGGPVAAGVVARTHRPGDAPRLGDRLEGAGRRPWGEHRGLLGGELLERAELGRAVPRARSVRVARPRSGEVGGGAAGAVVPAACRHRRSLRRGGAAAAGAGHRQRRRLPHDDRGSRPPRGGGGAERGLRHDGPRGADAGPRPSVLAVRDLDAAALPRHRPHQGTASRRQRLRRVRGATDLRGFRLRQRLQPVRPHLPRDRPGRGPLPQRSARRAQHPRAQCPRRHGAARLLHYGARPVRAVSRAAL